jgi:hypothetical protein
MIYKFYRKKLKVILKKMGTPFSSFLLIIESAIKKTQSKEKKKYSFIFKLKLS